MFEVRVAGGVSDGKILGEFIDFDDAKDQAEGYNRVFFDEDWHGKAVIIDQADQEGE